MHFGFEVLTAVAVKSTVFWGYNGERYGDILIFRRNILLLSKAGRPYCTDSYCCLFRCRLLGWYQLTSATVRPK
jgi:hypothetical protein